MKSEIDFLDHLRVSGEAIKDWPAWKRDIWPEVKTVSNSISEKSSFASSKFRSQFQSTHRQK